MKSVLCVAAADPSGGAGIACDIKSVSAVGVHPLLAITAVTVQNSCGVKAIYPTKGVSEQLETISEDCPPDAMKIGMLANEENVKALIEFIQQEKSKGKNYPIVLDPVMSASTGKELLTTEGVSLLKDELAPLVTLITPNRREMSLLLEGLSDKEQVKVEDRKEACLALFGKIRTRVLLKGGHFEGKNAEDLYYDGSAFKTYTSQRSDHLHTHGTGCCLSATIAAYLAKGMPLEEAIEAAKTDISRAIHEGYPMGQGAGPVDPILWKVRSRSNG